MVLCRFWAQGNCRKGDSCNFEHPSNNNNRQQNNNSSATFRGNHGVFGNGGMPERWQLSEADIESELTSTRPKWILSAYGPGRETPAALFVENEFSPEEIRWRYYEQAHAGNADAADREAQQLWQKANNDMLTASRNIRDVQKFMEEKERSRPNRYDYCKMDGTLSHDEYSRKVEESARTGSATGAFGAAAAQSSAANSFSKPAAASTAFGQASSPFGQPAQSSAFGQAAKPSAFGQTSQPSAFGQPAQASGFGQPAQTSAFGQPAQASAFGRPSQPSPFGKPAFGQSSASGQPAFGQTGFGQSNTEQPVSKFGGPIQNQSPFGTAAPQTASAFGQTSSLGQNLGASPTPAASGFGAGNGFGQAAQPSAFGKPAFGSTAAPSTGSPFGGGAAQNGNASPFGGTTAQNSNASPFGNSTVQAGNASPFGGAAQNAPSGGGFGTTNSGNPNTSSTPQQASPFGQSQPQQMQNTSPFGQPQPQGQQASQFGRVQQSSQTASPFGQPQQQLQQPSPFAPQRPQAQPANTFGQPQRAQSVSTAQNPFGQQPQSGFGTQSQPISQTSQPSTNPFGQTAPIQQAPQSGIQSSKPTDKGIRPQHYSQTLPPGRTQTGPDGRLSIYHNQPVRIIEVFRPTADGTEVKDTEYPIYNRPDGQGSERIWFPNGPQEPTVQKLARVIYDFQDENEAYNQTVKEQYGYLFENGSFKDHVVPLVPPERGWIDYDF